jgi:diguanylate cyclase (GGDEF)-like protein
MTKHLSKTTEHSLYDQAVEARANGHFDQAAELYREASEQAEGVEHRLHLRMREAYCRLSANDRRGAELIAAEVAHEARQEEFHAELADALGMSVEAYMLDERYAEASSVLSEAMYVMERVPNDPAYYQVIHNMAVTYQRCEFPVPAVELYDRALRLARAEIDRTFTYAGLASAFHMAMIFATDKATASRHLHDGIYAATAALDSQAEREVVTEATALAHRSVLLNAIGHHEAALVDAQQGRALAAEHGLREEEVVAMIGEAVARWHLSKDPAVVELLALAADQARTLGIEIYLSSAAPVNIDILWEGGRYDDAREMMTMQFDALNRALQREREARWEHVRLGVSLKSTEALSESDPLTNLPNRRYLSHWLPDVLENHGPVCVALLDLDGFKKVNDDYSYEHGDHLLLELSGILQRICRRGDAVIRLGGDEFVIVLRETSPNDARTVLDRVRQMIGIRSWQGLPPSVKVSASIGVSVGSGAGDAARVVHAAGEALHTAKREGRDRIVFR